MYYLFIIFFFHNIFGQIIENIPSKRLVYFFNLSLIIVIFIFTLGIRDTADWDMYYRYFVIENDKTDFVFYFLSKKFNDNHLSFVDLYKFHIVITLFLYLFLITRFTRNFFFVFLAYITFDYVHYVNQIRYYMGFPILMIGFYYLLYKKRYIISISLILLSILCHSALSVLLIFIPVYYISINNFLKLLLLLSTIVFVIVYAIFNLGIGIDVEHFGDYLNNDNLSSFVGGLFNALPYIICMTFLLYLNRGIHKKIDTSTLEGKKDEFIYKLCFFPIIFIPGALLLQIVGHRYIMPFSIFWFINYLYVIKRVPKKKRVFNYIIFSIVLLLSCFVIYILPDYLLPENHFKDQMETIIKSVDYFKGYFY